MKVCLIGKAGAGKSTLAKELAKRGYMQLSFAAKLKSLAQDMIMKMPDKTVSKDRELLQKLGTEIGRWYQPDLWIRHFELVYWKWCKFGKKDFVVDDARFKNEINFLIENGFMIVRVTGRSYDLGELGKHSSETELDNIKVDGVIQNDGSIQESMWQLDYLMKTWESAHR